MQDVIRLSNQPTARECRDDLFQIVQEGRSWLNRLGACPGTTVLPPSVELGRVTATVAKFCDRIDFIAKQIDRSVGRGHPRTPFLMTAFLEKMIGIAKRARVFPSTPSRAARTSGRPVPAFLKFVETALAIARDVDQIVTGPRPSKECSAFNLAGSKSQSSCQGDRKPARPDRKLPGLPWRSHRMELDRLKSIAAPGRSRDYPELVFPFRK